MPPKGFLKSDLSELIGYYLVSNTPNYLYKKFVSNNHIQWISTYYSLRELVDFYNQYNSLGTEYIVEKYVSLFAIILNEFEEANQALNILDLSKLEWGQEIKNIFYFTRQPANFVSKDANYKITSSSNLNSDAEAEYIEKSGIKIKVL